MGDFQRKLNHNFSQSTHTYTHEHHHTLNKLSEICACWNCKMGELMSRDFLTLKIRKVKETLRPSSHLFIINYYHGNSNTFWFLTVNHCCCFAALWIAECSKELMKCLPVQFQGWLFNSSVFIFHLLCLIITRTYLFHGKTIRNNLMLAIYPLGILIEA